MPLWTPTRRELIAGAPLLLGGAALPARLLAAPSLPLTFSVIGDWGRRGSPSQRKTAALINRRAAELGSQFVVATGDNFYKLGVDGVTDSHWDQSFEQVYSDQLKRRWYAVLGNHDYGGNIRAQIQMTDIRPGWRMCRRWWDERLAGWPDVHLFFIDTVVWIGRESFPYKWLGSPISKGDQAVQAEWLYRTLKASNARFKLVFGHHPIYSIGAHGGSMQLKELDDILRSGGAAAYISGHDHCLYYIEKAGMHYVCSGAGSDLLPEYSGDPEIHGCVIPGFCERSALASGDLPAWRFYEAEAGGFAAFTIGSTLELAFHLTDGKPVRRFILS